MPPAFSLKQASEKMQLPAFTTRDDFDETALSEIASTCQISTDQIEDVYGCTPLQKSMMAESVLYSNAGILQFVFSLSLSVDVDRFCAALKDVVTVNAILRTRLVDCRFGLVQVVTKEDHATVRLSGDAATYIHDDKTKHLGVGMPLFRSAVVDRKLVLTMHHAVVDGASTALLFGDVLRIYRGQSPEKHAPYKDFALHCSSIDDSAASSFWSPRFSGAPAIFPQVQQGHIPFTTQKMRRELDLKRLGTDISMSIMPAYIESAWALTAALYAGSESVAYGLLLSGRTPALGGLESTLGPTIAIVPVQVNLKRNSTTIEEILRERTTALRQLQTHSTLQYGMHKIRGVSDAARIASGFQTLINIRISSLFRDVDTESSDVYEYDHTEEPLGTFGLCLWFDLTKDGISLEAMSDPTVICESKLTRIMHQFEHSLQLLMSSSTQSRLDQLPTFNQNDQIKVLEWNRSLPQASKECVHELFVACARKRPTAPAVEASDGSATYQELDNLSSRLAQELRRSGVSKRDSVILIFEKSLWTIVAALAILKAAGVCVPVEPSDPRARREEIVARAKAKLVLTSVAEYANSADLAASVVAISSAFVAGLPEALNSVNDHIASSEDPAYMLFTSGSTGKPKGVVLDHSCVVSAHKSVAARVGWDHTTRMLQFAAHVWDMSVAEIYGALLSGGCLCVPSEETRRSGLARFIESNKVNWAILTPTVLRTLSPEDLPNLSSLISIGEPVGAESAKTWGSSVRFFNTWGPTEAHNVITAAELTPNSSFPESIGKPVGCGIWIVDPRNIEALSPIGVVGELIIEGPAVARGYLDDPMKTASVFIMPPSWAPTRAVPSRFYRTGDLAKYYPDGSICFIGRQDNQVKIRGQRFELGEVENVLSSCAELRDVFAATKIYKGRTELVAVACVANSDVGSAELQDEERTQPALQEVPAAYTETTSASLRSARDYARSKLPSFMVPSVWMAVTKMPRTASAKLDRTSIASWIKTPAAAKAVLALDPRTTETLTPPSTEEEKLLASIWSSILGVDGKALGRESAFIQLGGDSILAIRVASECRKRGASITTVAALTSVSLLDAAKFLSIGGATNGLRHPELEPSDVCPDENQNYVDVNLLGILDSEAPQYAHLRRHAQSGNIEAIAPATGTQAEMWSNDGYHDEYILNFKPALDVLKLQNAVAKVVLHHAILRTTFFQHDSKLFQVVLRDLSAQDIAEENDQIPLTVVIHEKVPALFYLFSDGKLCKQLRLKIHHALYDAFSLNLIIKDLDAAYTNAELSTGPHFHSWTSYLTTLEYAEATAFWKTFLRGSAMSKLATESLSPKQGLALTEKLQIRVAQQKLRTTQGTPSSVLQAVWALVLHSALEASDVLFAHVSANRYLPFPGAERVRGPCVNILPTRARLEENMKLSAVIAAMQDQTLQSIPFHHLSCQTISKDCASWPTGTRYGSILLYQNHGAFEREFSLGGAECTVSTIGVLGGSTDLWVIATPRPGDALEVIFGFNERVLGFERMVWIQRAMQILLEAVPEALDLQVGELVKRVQGRLGRYAA